MKAVNVSGKCQVLGASSMVSFSQRRFAIQNDEGLYAAFGGDVAVSSWTTRHVAQEIIDSLNGEGTWKGIEFYPLYESSEADDVMDVFKGLRADLKQARRQ